MVACFGAKYAMCQLTMSIGRPQKHTGIVTKKRRAEECAAGKQPPSKRQTTINGCVERQSAAAVAKLVMDVVESFMSANIPHLTIQSYGSFFKTQ